MLTKVLPTIQEEFKSHSNGFKQGGTLLPDSGENREEKGRYYRVLNFISRFFFFGLDVLGCVILCLQGECAVTYECQIFSICETNFFTTFFLQDTM